MESISEPKSAYFNLSSSRRWAIIGSALLALFLAALDAMVVSAAMPTIVADLGGLHLFSWVYTAFMLTRAITLPISGKLADIFGHRRIFLWVIALFIISSIAAGSSQEHAFPDWSAHFTGNSFGWSFCPGIYCSDRRFQSRQTRTDTRNGKFHVGYCEYYRSYSGWLPYYIFILEVDFLDKYTVGNSFLLGNRRES